ncbi:MAG: M48 family metallopeptidase [Mangrovibacterium sp.]
MSNLIEFKDIGMVELQASARAKRMKLGVKSNGTAFLVIPNLGIASKTIIENFVHQNADWIRKQQAKFSSQQTIFTPETNFHTYNRKLSIITHQRAEKVTAALLAHEIRVILTPNSKIASDKVQNFIRHVIEESMREEAKMVLPQIAAKFATQYQLHFNQVSIKKAKTRWGSCSSKRNLNFNLHLMRLPHRLIDYVVLHELAHTVEMNHGDKFWNLLENICPGAKKLDKELNQYHTEIY